ncbi:hypothetical protein SLS58_011258 [Diplodia intermedia]|uniref:RING-type domain-containing protein n=1 Tax=Diplodia intermedia TaxID=856260 RepID=A0ABR3T1N7_9PEZI
MEDIRQQFPYAAMEPTTAARFQALSENNDVRCPVCFRDIDFSELGHQVSSTPQHKESISITSENDNIGELHNQEASSPRPQHRRRNITSAAEESDKDSAATVASPPPQRRRPTTIHTRENSNGDAAAATVIPSVASTAGTPETTTTTHAVDDFSSSTSATTIPPPASTGTPELTTPLTNEPSSSSRIAAAADEADTDTDTPLTRTDLVTMTACNHVICALCQLTWLRAEADGKPYTSPSCALCRHSTTTPQHQQHQQEAATSAEATATYRADLLLPAPAAAPHQLAFYAASFDHAVRGRTPIRDVTAPRLVRAGAAIAALLAADEHHHHRHAVEAFAALPALAGDVVRVLGGAVDDDGDRRDTGTGVGGADRVRGAVSGEGV